MGYMEKLRREIRVRHYSIRTEHAYIGWVKEFLWYYDGKHPSSLGNAEIQEYLSHLADMRRVSASTQNQALSGLLFFYRHVLKRNIGSLDDVVRAKNRPKLPTVLSVKETEKVLSRLNGIYSLLGLLMYGTGMRDVRQ